MQRWNTHEAVVAEMNLILGHNDRSTLFWKDSFKQLIDVFFTGALFEHEMSPDFDMRQSLAEYELKVPELCQTSSPVRALNVLIARIGAICIIKFREESQLTFVQSGMWFDLDTPVDIMDIVEIGVRAKLLSSIAHCEVV